MPGLTAATAATSGQEAPRPPTMIPGGPIWMAIPGRKVRTCLRARTYMISTTTSQITGIPMITP